MKSPIESDPMSGHMRELVAVRQEISRYRRQATAERLALYRKNLQVTVTRATPLLRIVVRDQGIDLKGALTRLRPPSGWPDRLRALDRLKRPMTVARLFGSRLAVWPFSSGEAVLVRDAEHPLGALSVGLNGSALEMLIRIGNVHVATREGLIAFTLPFELPEAVAAAAPGRSVGTLVGHQWFADPTWIIDGVRCADSRTTVWVRADHEPFVMPWRRLVGSGRPRRLCERPAGIAPATIASAGRDIQALKEGPAE